jgi:hypothetical protein
MEAMGFGQALWLELKAAFKRGFKVLLWTIAAGAVLGLAFGISVCFDPQYHGSKVLAPIVAMFYVAFLSFWVGLAAGGFAAMWRLIGAAAALPLFLVPGGAALSVWLGGGWLVSVTQSCLESIGKTFSDADFGNVRVHDPASAVIVLVVVLFVHVLRHPEIFFYVLAPLLVLALLVLLGGIAGGGTSVPFLIVGFVRRIRARMAAEA